MINQNNTNYSVRGCGFESHQLLPEKGFLQSPWFPFFNIGSSASYPILPPWREKWWSKLYSWPLDRPLEAEECYRKALSIKSDHINANANMGHLCRLQERWVEAREYYTTAVRRRPRNSLLHYNIGFVSEKIGTSLDIQVRVIVCSSLCEWFVP